MLIKCISLPVHLFSYHQHTPQAARHFLPLRIRGMGGGWDWKEEVAAGEGEEAVLCSLEGQPLAIQPTTTSNPPPSLT